MLNFFLFVWFEHSSWHIISASWEAAKRPHQASQGTIFVAVLPHETAGARLEQRWLFGRMRIQTSSPPRQARASGDFKSICSTLIDANCQVSIGGDGLKSLIFQGVVAASQQHFTSVWLVVRIHKTDYSNVCKLPSGRLCRFFSGDDCPDEEGDSGDSACAPRPSHRCQTTFGERVRRASTQTPRRK